QIGEPVEEFHGESEVSLSEGPPGGRVRPVAQHGDQENLQEEPGSALVPAPQRDSGGNGRARAVARDDETAGVGARGGSVPVGPRNGGEAVVDGRGERV